MPAHYLTNTESTIFRYWRKSSLVGIVSTRDLQGSKLPRKEPAIKRALETRPDRVRVASAMTTNVRTAEPSDTVADAADLMLREHVGALAVMEEAHLRGIITRSDIIGASVALGTHNRMRPAKVQDPQASICTGRSALRSKNIYEKS